MSSRAFPQRFRGKVALITGAARGQGRAEAVRLSQEGADIVAIDICRSLEHTTYPGSTSDDLAETVALVEANDQRVVAVRADVRDFAAMANAVERGLDELGRLDVVIANAGITTAALTWEITAEQWQETIDVNLTGVFHTVKTTVPVLLDQAAGGSIVITSSVAGLRGLPFLGHYVASKHGVTGLAKTLANELADKNIRVNTIHPHGVATGMNVTELFPMIESHADNLGRLFSPALPDSNSEADDIAAAVAWLASDEARHVTGVQLPLDLGRTNR